MDNLNFTENLIKGKIAEIIFEMMFSHLEGYKLAHFGVEYTSPGLLDKKIRDENKILLDRIGDTPDFIKIDNKNKVTLVEVKYRRSLEPEILKEITMNIYESWPEAALYIVTPQGFFFDVVKTIIENNGVISPLSKEIIPEETQAGYLKILEKFNLS